MFYTFSKKTQPLPANLQPLSRNKNTNTNIIRTFGSMFDIKGPVECPSCPKPSRRGGLAPPRPPLK